MSRNWIILIALGLVCSFRLHGKLRRQRASQSLPRRRFKVPAEYKKKASEEGSSSVFAKLVHIFDESDTKPQKVQDETKKLKRKKLWKKDFVSLKVEYLEHPVATTLDIFDDDVQVSLESDDIEYQEFLRETYGKKLDNHILAPLYISWVNTIVGYGLFANNHIKCGDYIGELTGKIAPVASVDTSNPYLFHYPSSNEDKQFVIDAQEEGSMLRFVNHDERPNVEAEYVFHKGLWHLFLIAADDIEEGQQLTIDYGQNFWKDRKEPVPVF